VERNISNVSVVLGQDISDLTYIPQLGGCEYVRGNWREGGAGHIRQVICSRRLKRCVEPVETRQSAQQIFTPFIRVRYTGLPQNVFVSLALCGRSAALGLSKCAASNCGI